MSRRREVPPKVRELAAQLASPRPMRRGSVSERYVKCTPYATSPADEAALFGKISSLFVT